MVETETPYLFLIFVQSIGELTFLSKEGVTDSADLQIIMYPSNKIIDLKSLILCSNIIFYFKFFV